MTRWINCYTSKRSWIKINIVGSDGWDGVVKTVDPSSYAAIENVYFANHYSTKDSNEKNTKLY